jgi:transposase
MMERSMTHLENMSTPSAALDQNSTLICVVEMSLKGWLVAGLVPGIKRQPLKKLETDEAALHRLLLCWKAEAERAGQQIARIALAFEAGRGSLAGCGLAALKLG